MLFALSGPSGIGKGYIKQRVASVYPGLRELVWFTTRPLRPGETANGNRRPVSRETFDALVASGECVLEQELYGNGYGLSREELLSCEGVWFTEFHPENLARARDLRDDIVAIGLVTDDLDLLAERIARRDGSDEDCAARLSQAAFEMELIRRSPHYQLIATSSRDSEEATCEEVVNFIVNRIRRIP